MRQLFQISICIAFLISCDKNDDVIQSTENVRIRILNNSEFTLTQISILSIPFDDLKKGELSPYKVLNFDSEKDDPMIHLTVEDNLFGKYITPPDSEGKYTYIIDSIRIENRLINISRIEN